MLEKSQVNTKNFSKIVGLPTRRCSIPDVGFIYTAQLFLLSASINDLFEISTEKVLPTMKLKASKGSTIKSSFMLIGLSSAASCGVRGA